MKILIPLLALMQLSTADASLMAIMDSGTDISHKALSPKTWINRNEVRGSKVDLDNSGLPGDINGWDFTENSAKVFNDKYNHLITEDVKTFLNYYGKLQLGQLSGTSAELAWLKTHNEDPELMNKVNFIGGYIHGTHVAGIAADKNPGVKILSMKILPTVYEELRKEEVASKSKLSAKSIIQEPIATIDQYTADVVDNATAQVSEMIALHTYLEFHKVDVVNQSFGIGYGDAERFITSGFITALKREPTEAELKAIVGAFFNQILKEGPKMFAASPNSLFTIAAGNDNSNNDLFPDYPANIDAENKIVVAATLGYKMLAKFSNYGATKVDVAAPGVAITATAPTNAYIALSGTSQAAPYVANIISMVKDVNPALSAREMKAIILGTVDVKTWLRGRVKTSGIVNKARALKAAGLSKTQALDLAITNARAIIADVPVEKSFGHKMLDVNLNFKPVRPSLFIPKITE